MPKAPQPTAEPLADPVRRAPARPAVRTREQKYDERRNQLAVSALATLGELGYARTSLREIAQKSPFSHGVVHYYFKDKSELITYCVRYYKAQCVTRYDALVAESATAAELSERFAAKLMETMADEAPMHQLWYDLRTQSMFEPQLRPGVMEIEQALQAMICRVVDRYAELAGRPTVFDGRTAYALLDGVFEKALLYYVGGERAALDDLGDQARLLLPRLLG